jgi:twitching motility two-component system response regulator PilH
MSTPKILIVDDSESRAARLEAIVREAGYSPLPAGQDVLERARAERPDLILLRVELPETDGYEICRALRSDRELQHIPLLTIVAMRKPADQLWAHLQGASGVVDDKSCAEQLIGAIRTTLI